MFISIRGSLICLKRIYVLLKKKSALQVEALAIQFIVFVYFADLCLAINVIALPFINLRGKYEISFHC